MQITRSKISARKIDKVAKQEGILTYDVDNAYPQRVTDIVDASGITKSCVKLYAKFIEGGGFKDQTFYKAVINSKGLTLDKLLRFLAKDFALRNGFAIHVNYNANYQITELTPLKFEDVRLMVSPDGALTNKLAVYPDWGKRVNTRFNKDKIHHIDKFNPDPVIIESQVEEAKGWGNYKGQILWYSDNGDNYPLAPFDAVLEDCETDGRIKSHKRKKAATGWNADYMFVHKGKFENDLERELFVEDLEAYQGDEASGNIMLVEVDKEEQIPTLVKFDKSAEKENFYTYNESSVQSNIRKAFNFPPPLVGDFTPGKLGMNQEIVEACAYVNGITNPERRVIEETFQRLIPLFEVDINPTKDYSIIPLELVAPVKPIEKQTEQP